MKKPCRFTGLLPGRDDWIRTSDPYVPNVVRYRAALHPEKIIPTGIAGMILVWSGGLDSNQRPLAPHTSALPGCATTRISDWAAKLSHKFSIPKSKTTFIFAA